jgi:4-hydroxythreonine-4-phosphate dehydrogenase
MGDPAGIGPEIVVRSIGAAMSAGHQPLLFGDHQTYRDAARICDLALDIEPFLAAGPATSAPRPADAGWGSCTEWAGREQIAGLRAALAAADRGEIDAVVFAPFNKHALALAGIVGDETEVLKAHCGLSEVRTVTKLDAMLRATVVGHVPFAGIAAKVTGEGIVAALDRLSGLCCEFGNSSPRIGVAALNPHAGDRGTLGHEERDYIAPTIERYRERTGANVSGPIPPDILMPLALRGQFDALVYLYHDQGNIAMKAVGFGREVVFYPSVPHATATVAHGTAYDIAGKGVADPQNFIAAVLQTADLAQRRRQRQAEPGQGAAR